MRCDKSLQARGLAESLEKCREDGPLEKRAHHIEDTYTDAGGNERDPLKSTCPLVTAKQPLRSSCEDE